MCNDYSSTRPHLERRACTTTHQSRCNRLTIPPPLKDSFMVDPARPSEDAQFEAVRARSLDPFTSWIAASSFSTADQNEILDVLRRASSLVMARASKAKAAEREAFLDGLRAALESKLGPDAGSAFDATRGLLDTAQEGYRRILAALGASEYAKLTPEVRISAALVRAAEQAIVTRRDVDAMLEGQSAAYVQSLSLRDVFGRPIAPEALSDAIVETVGATLNLEGRGQKWVGDDEIISIPPLAQTSEADRFKAGSNEVLSLAWRNWGLLEEKVRFLGGRLVHRTRPDLPADFPTDLDDLFASLDTPSNFDTWTAQHRMNDGSLQNHLQSLGARDLLAATVDHKVGAPLPPLRLVSPEEGLAYTALESILGYSPGTDVDEIDGLRLVEWLRGLSVLRQLAHEAIESSPTDPHAWLIPFDPADLITALTRNGLSSDKATRFIDQARFRTSSVDLYDAPLIQCQDGGLVAFGPALFGVNAANTLMSIFARKEVGFDRKGKSFEARVIRLLRGAGLKAVDFKTKKNGEEYEYDALLLWGDRLFVFECKNRSLPYDNPVRVRNFQRDAAKHVRQVQRLCDGLLTWPEIVVQAFGEPLGERTIVPVVLNNLPYARSGATDGVYFYDYPALSRFFHSRALTMQVATGENHGRRAKINTIRLWRGTMPEPADLIRQLEDPVQLRVTRNLTRQSDLNFQLDGKSVASEPRLFREDMTPEAIGQAMGFPRHVMKAKTRALVKRVKKKEKARRQKPPR